MKKLVAILIALFLFGSMFAAVTRTVAASPTTDTGPTAIDKIAPMHSVINDLGTLNQPTHHSAYVVGDYAYFLGLNDYYGYYFVSLFQLRAIGPDVEIWVQNNLAFPSGDPRAYPTILDSEVAYLLTAFENTILPNDTHYFGNPVARDGSTAALPGMLGLPANYYAEGNTKNIILVENVRDQFYYQSTYPYYIAGFFTSAFNYYLDRNTITIDCWHWEYRLGPAGTVWIPPIQVTRPFVYESTIAHEYQHLIHNDWNPNDDTFMNEGCSMYAEFLCGYGIDPSYINSYLYTPDNSLTEWGDQGDINILADYGAAALWLMYINDHYGGAATISYFVQNGIPGIDGVNAALVHAGYKHSTFDTVYHDWRIANLIHTDFPGCTLYNYKSLNLNDPIYISAFTHTISGLPVPQTKGTDFGDTFTDLGYDTGVSMIGPYGSDYINFTDWKQPGFIYFQGDQYATYGWTQTGGVWWSGYGNMLNAQLVSQAVTVTSSNPTLTLVTAYGIETTYDFGFVQVSTDSGATWTSLANAYTTSSYQTDVQAIINNMPGLNDYNPDWPGYTTMTFDLSAYIGKTVMIDFRYMTDEATNYEGWFIQSAGLGTTALTLTPVYPKATFQVSVIQAFVICGKTLFLPYDMCLTKDNKGMGIGAAIKPSYVLLVVSPTMHQGFVDYKFQATKLPLFKFFC